MTEQAIDPRQERGVQLAEEYADDIRFSILRKAWLVPGSEGATYTVKTVQPFCTCRDQFLSRAKGEPIKCKHIHAVEHIKRTTEPCDGCGKRFPMGTLYEVMESLSFFEGDRICEGCANDSCSEVV